MPDLLKDLTNDIYIGQNPKTYEWRLNNPGIWTKNKKVVNKFTRYIKYSEHEKLLKQLEKLKQDYACATLGIKRYGYQY